MTNSPLFADLSSNESSFDAGAYRRSGHILIALKLTEGLGFLDPRHHDWTHAAHAEGIAVIHYHFGRPDLHNGGDEAAFFLREGAAYFGPHDYVCYDGERRAGGRFGLQVDHARNFDEHVQRHSRFHALLYASASQLAGARDALVGNVRRDWDANYSSAPDTHAPGHELIARQFTNGLVGPGPHTLPGCGQCDVNVMHGSLLHDVFANVNTQKRA